MREKYKITSAPTWCAVPYKKRNCIGLLSMVINISRETWICVKAYILVNKFLIYITLFTL